MGIGEPTKAKKNSAGGVKVGGRKETRGVRGRAEDARRSCGPTYKEKGIAQTIQGYLSNHRRYRKRMSRVAER